MLERGPQGDAATAIAAALAELPEQPGDLPPRESSAYRYSLNYARDFFSAERVAQSRARCRALGFAGGQRMLDVGCGAGQWCVAALDFVAQVHGIDRSAHFVGIDRAYAAACGLDERLHFNEGAAEKLDFPTGHFDRAVCHGVLQFTDHEQTLNELGRVIAPGGLLYLGWTGGGLRLSSASQAIAAGEPAKAGVAANILLTHRMYQAGAFLARRVRTLSHDFDDVRVMLDFAGFDVIERPGLQDAAGDFLGYAKTWDCLARRREHPATPQAVLAARLAESRMAPRAFADHLLARGLPRLVDAILSADWMRLGRRDRTALRALVQLKLGPREAPPPPAAPKHALARWWDRPTRRDTAVVAALSALAAGRTAEVLEHCDTLATRHEWGHGPFVRAAARYLGGEPKAAREDFARCLARTPVDLGAWAGALLCALDTQDAADVDALLRWLEGTAPASSTAPDAEA